MCCGYCCSLLQAYEDSAARSLRPGAGQRHRAMVLVEESGFGKQIAEYGRCEVGKACDGMRRTVYSVHRLLFQVRRQRREQPVCRGHDFEDVLSCWSSAEA